MYNSQYYTCEQIDERLLQGYLDDYNEVNNTNLTKAQFLSKLYNILNSWKGIDDEPTAGSKNLVESGGVHTRFVSFYDLFKGNHGSVSINGEVYANENYLYTDYIKLHDGYAYDAQVFYHSVIAPCYVYSEKKEKLGQYIPSEVIQGTNGTYKVTIDVAAIKALYPTAYYIRLSGQNAAVDASNYPYIAYPLENIQEDLTGYIFHGIGFVDKSGEQKTLAQALASVPVVFKDNVRLLSFAENSANRYSLYYRDTASGFDTADNWFKLFDRKSIMGIFYNVNDPQNTSTTYTFNSAIAAVPSKNRGIAQVISYRTANSAEIAIFKSKSYSSGYTNPDNWIVIGFDEKENIKCISNRLTHDENLLLKADTTNIFNFRAAEPLRIGIRYSASEVTATSTPDFVVSVLLKSNISTDKTYVWNRFDGASHSYLRYIQLVTMPSAMAVGATEYHTGNFNSGSYRGYINNIPSTHQYLYLMFVFNSAIQDINQAVDIVNGLLETICVKEATSIDYFTEYVDYFSPKNDLQFGSENAGKVLQVGNDGSVSPQTMNINTLGGTPVYQGSENAGKILGVGLDGNIRPSINTPSGTIEGMVQYHAAGVLYLGADLLSGVTVNMGTGWSGDMANGFSHASGNTAILEIAYNTTSNKKYVVGLTLSSAAENSIFVGIGDSPSVDVYNGTTDINIGFLSLGGTIKITPKSSWVGTITNITLKEIVAQEDADSELLLDLKNVNHGQTVGNITGFWNVAVGGENTLRENQNGSRNIGIGYSALYNFISGTRNIGIGTFALSQLKSGDHNIAIGADALWYVQNATDNVCVGFGTFWQQRASLKVIRCVAIGAKNAMGAQTSSTDNITIGVGACNGTVDKPEKNVSIGVESGYLANKENVAIGHNAGKNTNGNYNVAVGSRAGASTTSAQNNSIAIGYGVKTTKSNQVVIGNTDQTEIVLLGNKKIIFNQDGTVTWEAVS